jgi:aromatic-amino-acid transaminase
MNCSESQRRDSNPRPSDYKSEALPAMLRWRNLGQTGRGHECVGRTISSALIAEHMAGETLLNAHALRKHGNDAIFSWFARYQKAHDSGIDAVNATVGSLLEEDGSLATNSAVVESVRNCPPVEFSAYAPLRGLPRFLDLSKSLALGDARQSLENAGISIGSIATPGGSGALYLTAANLVERGHSVLLRDRHWAPYDGFLSGSDLSIETWPLLPSGDSQYPYFDLTSFEEKISSLKMKQDKIMIWLNDPAHNPTGLSLTAEGRIALLDSMITSALADPEIGHTLVIDAAYSLYADDAYGWADSIVEVFDNGSPWPENLLLCFAVSFSKSHTIYGMRNGVLISLHPEQEVIDRLQNVFGVTGRSTWSAAPRIGQYCLTDLHSSPEQGAAWATECERLKKILDNRRITLLANCEAEGVILNPAHDGFFAWFECDQPEIVAEHCAKQDVFVVPLEGGIRIGLCSMPLTGCERVAKALASAPR